MRLKTLIQNKKMLINNEVDLKNILGGVQQTITWQTMEPFVKQAELEFVVPAIGEELYDELIAVVNASDLQQKLIDRLSIAVANYALAGALPQLVTVIGDAGAAMNNQGVTNRKSNLNERKKMNRSGLLNCYMPSSDEFFDCTIDLLMTFNKMEIIRPL